AIAIATSKSPDVAIAGENAAIADDKIADTKSKRYPSLKADGGAERWNGAPTFMGFTLHEKVTTNVNVTLMEPLTGLGALSELVGATEHSATAAHADVDKARLDAAYRAAAAYLHALAARTAADVAHKTVAQIQGELERAEKLRAADQYNDIDVLRFKSAKAAADQAAVRADAARDGSLAALVVALGLHDGESIDVVDDLPPAPPAIAMSIEQSQDRALGARPELKAARERIAAANDSRKAAYSGYFPDIRALAQYQHASGSPFQPNDQGFVGVSLSWTLWDWGSTRDGVRTAEHQQRAAEIGADALVDQVRLDVRQRWLDAKAGYDNLAAAATQLEAAEEAYRLQQVRFDAAAATATDVLDAETDVARARLAATNARYDYFVALVALARSVGDLPGANGAATR
ncbi:MAG TPA: TolC family protein, partial [Kofleriaceae bacterium]|nr:TolC family protein [Kofleriaceae bacterium]